MAKKWVNIEVLEGLYVIPPNKVKILQKNIKKWQEYIDKIKLYILKYKEKKLSAGLLHYELSIGEMALKDLKNILKSNKNT